MSGLWHRETDSFVYLPGHRLRNFSLIYKACKASKTNSGMKDIEGKLWWILHYSEFRLQALWNASPLSVWKTNFSAGPSHHLSRYHLNIQEVIKLDISKTFRSQCKIISFIFISQFSGNDIRRLSQNSQVYWKVWNVRIPYKGLIFVKEITLCRIFMLWHNDVFAKFPWRCRNQGIKAGNHPTPLVI